MKPPRGLKPPGRAFWKTTTESFDLRGDELVTLEQVCKLMDVASRLEDLVNGADLVVGGSMGQPRISPALPELRATRVSIARLLGQLGFSDQSSQLVGQAKSDRGRSLARLRWSAG